MVNAEFLTDLHSSIWGFFICFGGNKLDATHGRFPPAILVILGVQNDLPKMVC